MANILVVDDRAINRQLLVTLLGYQGHRVLEAADGEEALEVLDRERVALVITDIMMPRMDGVELAKRIRARKATAGLPVVFYTATYRAREARMMAEECGVDYVLPKPSAPEAILRVVDSLVHQSPAKGQTGAARGRTRLVAMPSSPPTVDTIASTTRDLSAQRMLSRLAAVIELALDSATEPEPERLFEMFGRAAQGILAAKLVGLAVLDVPGSAIQHCFVKRGKRERAAWFDGKRPPAGVLAELMADGRTRRFGNEAASAQALGLPATHPPVRFFLGAPVRSPTRTYGWLYAVDRTDGHEFDESDERLAATIAAQIGLVYENVCLAHEVQRAAGELAQRHQELAQAHRDLEQAVELAVTDPLTGLANHRGAHLRLAELMDEACSGQLPLSLILGDIDGFKLFNDTYGHAGAMMS